MPIRMRKHLAILAVIVLSGIGMWMYFQRSSGKGAGSSSEPKRHYQNKTTALYPKPKSAPPAMRPDIEELQRQQAATAKWKENFPFKPTTDPAVTITQEILDVKASGIHHTVIGNHSFLKSFFENEARFSPQFQALHAILDRYDRGDNPVQAGHIMQCLWEYRKAAQHPPDEIVTWRIAGSSTEEPLIFNTPSGKTTKTWGEQMETYRDGILYHLSAPRKWPDKPMTAEGGVSMKEAIALEMLDQILAIPGVEQMPDPLFAYHGDYEDQLQLGDIPLVISVGWQEAYDEWREIRKRARSRPRPPPPPRPQLGGIGPNNELLDPNGNPIQVRNGERINAVMGTPDGQRVPLNRGPNGEMILPTPAQIQELNKAMSVPADN